MAALPVRLNQIEQIQHKSKGQKVQVISLRTLTLYYSLLRLDSKNSFPDLNQSLPDEDKHLITQTQSSGSFQNNNPEKQVDALNLENSVTLEKAKASRRNQVSHSISYDYSNSPPDFNDLHISVNEKCS